VTLTYNDFNAKTYSENDTFILHSNKDGEIDLGNLEGVSKLGL
jgi:hypothetical protein